MPAAKRADENLLSRFRAGSSPGERSVLIGIVLGEGRFL